MKMFVIVYSSAIDDAVLGALKKSGVDTYTKITNILGSGKETGPKLNTRFWVGDNDVLTVVVEDEDSPTIRDVVLGLRKEYPRSGVRCFVIPVEEMI